MDIAIIGAGFTGVALARTLLREAPDGTRIALVGSPESFARGVAYGTRRAEHYLNVRASELGIDPDAPADFADWLELEMPTRDGFLPRALYGDYLAHRLDEATAAAQGRVLLHTLRLDAVSAERVGTRYRVYLSDGSDFVATRVVLALGALPPQPLAELAPSLLAHARYVASPWEEAALAKVDPDAAVLVVGTGLTFADVATSLKRQGHRGSIDAISRHGLLPQRHPARRSVPMSLPLGLQRAIDEGDLRRALRAVRDALNVVDDWRGLFDALRPQVQHAWSRLDATQRARFLRHLRAHWETHRHRLAPSVADDIDTLRGRGQLRVRAARLLHARLEHGRIEALVRQRGHAHVVRERYDVLVRATGLDTDIQRSTHALVSHLREAGLVRADPHGLGFVANEAFSLLDRSGAAVPGLYGVGPLLRGRFWEITAVPELRRAAQALGCALAAQIGSDGARERAQVAAMT